VGRRGIDAGYINSAISTQTRLAFAPENSKNTRAVFSETAVKIVGGGEAKYTYIYITNMNAQLIQFSPWSPITFLIQVSSLCFVHDMRLGDQPDPSRVELK
jgi:hypothetical protein